jgi:hypothetical protein
MRIWCMILSLLLWSDVAFAQQDFPTELDDCTGPGADFCFDGVPALLDSECAAIFEGYDGRIAWPPLRNMGPVTIAVQTRFRVGSGPQGSFMLPLYVEVRNRTSEFDRLECDTGLSGSLVLVANGSEQCGGIWESVGPLDLTRYGLPLGALYSVHCVFFRLSPQERTTRSVGFSCIRVTSNPTTVAAATWGLVKSLYKGVR